MTQRRFEGWRRAGVAVCNPARPLGWLAALAMFVPGWASAQVLKSIAASADTGSEVVRLEFDQPLSALPSGFVIQTPPRVAVDLPGVSSGLDDGQVNLAVGKLRSATVAEGSGRTRVILNLSAPSGYQIRQDGVAVLITLAPEQGVPVAKATAPTPVATVVPASTSTASEVSKPAAALIIAASGAVASDTPSNPRQPSAAPVVSTSLPAVAAGSLRQIDFRRSPDGAGRVLVDLTGVETSVDIKAQGNNLVLEFPKAQLPEVLRRRIDVADFATPIRAVSAFQNADRVRLVVENSGSWEHSAYQTDAQFVLEVRAVQEQPNKLTQGPGYAGDKLSLNFQNIDIRALLQVIADFTNLNVVTSDTVTGNVSLRLKDVPWDQALDIVLNSKGLGVRKVGNVLLVAPKEELAKREQADLESKAKVADLEPVKTQSFQLNYTKAEEIAKALNGSTSTAASSTADAGGTGGKGSAAPGGRILSPRGSVMFEARTNQLFVTDIPSRLEQVQAMIAKLDIPVRQVMIEARIVEADDSFGRALGVKLGGNDLRGVQGGVPGYSVGGGNYVTIGGNLASVGSQTLQGPTASFADSSFVNLPANVGSLGGSAATFALSLFGASSNRFLNLELSALESEGRGKIISSPRIITADQVKALIEQGEELPYQAAAGTTGATQVQFKKANLKLEVVPQITPEGSVILDVDVNKDSVGRSTAAGFGIDTKHVKTQVLVENGGTVVIGGIFIQTESENTNKVPLLGDVPVVGNLFKNRVRSTKKTELMVFLTPRVLTDRTSR
jgi:type IV pilus assembly protein PilQ